MHEEHRQVRQTARPAGRRRGTIYVLVLGAAAILMAIGMSAISLSRASAYNTAQSNDWLDSQYFAITATDHALTKLNADDNWRITYNGVTTRQTIGNKTFTWRVVDEQDGDLTDGLGDPAVLYVSTTAGKAAYNLKINLETTTAAGGGGTVLWGVDSSDGTLFSVSNYNRITSTITRYGQLKWNDNGTIRTVGAGIKAFALTSSGDAYMACNAVLGAMAKPVLIKFNVNTASTNGNNVVTRIGSVAWNKDITGLAIAPDTGNLYALAISGGNGVADRLLILNKETAAITQNVGPITGSGATVGNGGDIVYSNSGMLYVSAGADRRVFTMDKTTAALRSVYDGQVTLAGQIAALAWDDYSQKLLGSETSTSILYLITAGDWGNTALGSFSQAGLSTVEGMGFIPGSSGGGGGGLVVRPALSGSSIKRTVQ